MSETIAKGEDVAFVSGKTVLEVARRLIEARVDEKALEAFGNITVIVRSKEAAAIKLFVTNNATPMGLAKFDPPTCTHKPL